MLTRIRSYYQNGKWTGQECLSIYNQAKSLKIFRQKNPEYSNCIIVAEDYDETDPKHFEHYEMCIRYGCIL